MADDAVVLLVVTECVWVDDQVRSHGQRDIRPAVTFPSELPPPRLALISHPAQGRRLSWPE